MRVTAGYGDSCTYPISTCAPQCTDHEAIRAKADMSAGCIVDGLKEGKEETQKILEAFAASFIEGREIVEPVKDFTRGHFRRGVE